MFKELRWPAQQFLIRIWDLMDVESFMSFPLVVTIVGERDRILKSVEEYRSFLMEESSMTSYCESNIELQNLSNFLNITIHCFTYNQNAHNWHHFYPMENIVGFSEGAYATHDDANSVVLYHKYKDHYEVIVSRPNDVEVSPANVSARPYNATRMAPPSSAPQASPRSAPKATFRPRASSVFDEKYNPADVPSSTYVPSTDTHSTNYGETTDHETRSTATPSMNEYTNPTNGNSRNEFNSVNSEPRQNTPMRTSTLRPGGAPFSPSNSFDEMDLVNEAPNTTPSSSLELPDIEHIRKRTMEDIGELHFQAVVSKRGRPKKSREGTPAKKRKKVSNFIDDALAAKPKQQQPGNRKYVRGPYKSNLKDHSQQNCSQNRSYVRGPYKKQNISRSTLSSSYVPNDQAKSNDHSVGDSLSSFEDQKT